jgi:hypothetical protein
MPPAFEVCSGAQSISSGRASAETIRRYPPAQALQAVGVGAERAPHFLRGLFDAVPLVYVQVGPQVAFDVTVTGQSRRPHQQKLQKAEGLVLKTPEFAVTEQLSGVKVGHEFVSKLNSHSVLLLGAARREVARALVGIVRLAPLAFGFLPPWFAASDLSSNRWTKLSRLLDDRCSRRNSKTRLSTVFSRSPGQRIVRSHHC